MIGMDRTWMRLLRGDPEIRRNDKQRKRRQWQRGTTPSTPPPSRPRKGGRSGGQIRSGRKAKRRKTNERRGGDDKEEEEEVEIETEGTDRLVAPLFNRQRIKREREAPHKTRKIVTGSSPCVGSWMVLFDHITDADSDAHINLSSPPLLPLQSIPIHLLSHHLHHHHTTLFRLLLSDCLVLMIGLISPQQEAAHRMITPLKTSGESISNSVTTPPTIPNQRPSSCLPQPQPFRSPSRTRNVTESPSRFCRLATELSD